MTTVETRVFGNNGTEISGTSIKPSLIKRVESFLLRFRKPKEILPPDKSAECPYFIENPKEN